MSKLSKGLMAVAALAVSLMGASAIRAHTTTPSGDSAAAPMGHGGMPMMQMMQQMGQMMTGCSAMMKQHQGGNAAPQDRAPPSTPENPHNHN